LEKATGRKVELKAVERDQLADFFGQQIPQAHVPEFMEMVTGALPGGIIVGDFEYDEITVRGEIELVDSLREMTAN
jgi:hypothetical protein